MKKVLFVMVILSACSSFASRGSEGIYKALDVIEEPMRSQSGDPQFKKSVGGVICVKLTGGREQYACSLTFSQLQANVLYNAMNTQTEVAFTTKNQKTFKKSAGGLTCYRATYARKADMFNCMLSL